MITILSAKMIIVGVMLGMLTVGMTTGRLLGDQVDGNTHKPSVPPCLLDQSQESNESYTVRPHNSNSGHTSIILTLCLGLCS